MDIIKKTGAFNIESTLKVVDPDITLEAVNYNYLAKKATIVVRMENTGYSHSRELPQVDFVTPFTVQELQTVLNNYFNAKKETEIKVK